MVTLRMTNTVCQHLHHRKSMQQARLKTHTHTHTHTHTYRTLSWDSNCPQDQMNVDDYYGGSSRAPPAFRQLSTRTRLLCTAERRGNEGAIWRGLFDFDYKLLNVIECNICILEYLNVLFCFFKSKPNWKLVELIMFNHVSSRKKTWISIDQQHLSLSKWAFAFTELVRHIIHTDANTVMICYLSMWNIHHNDESQMKVNAELWSLVNDRAQTTIGWNPEPHSGGRPVLGCTANIKCVFIWPRPSVAGLGFGSASWGLYQITLWKVSLIFW